MVNKVILLGNVGKDPEIKYFDNDVAVANFSLATTERGFKTRDGQEIPDRTEWHNIVAWRGLAKLAENYIKKGSQLYVEGKIRTRSYDDANGVKRYITEIVADVINFVGRKPASDDNAITQNQTSHSANPASPAQNSASPQPDNQANDPFAGDTGNDVEDDLPF
ncbi:single-stranded DNA-binding protein [Geofilum sp. OHC36d9]|uniref:single-stranded DNA-binding protein n=1 Tax=Geofilum sp. OHC36d9 TaxID=3458413 RepID=UPI004033DA6C